MSREELETWIKAHPVAGDPGAMREVFEFLTQSRATGDRVCVNDVPGLAFGAGSPIVWLHGGGYVFGSPHSHAAAASRLAAITGSRVLVPDYRLAPEHPWPAALDDACAFVSGCEAPVAIVGDSAGGHLAVNVARRLPSKVHALALISPNTDRTGLSGTRQVNTPSDLMNADEDDARLADMAMGHLFAGSRDVSPIYADLTMLPPCFVTASQIEVLYDDARLLIAALRRQGVAVETAFVSDMFHLWPLWPDHLVQARRTIASIAEFVIRQRVAGTERTMAR